MKYIGVTGSESLKASDSTFCGGIWESVEVWVGSRVSRGKCGVSPTQQHNSLLLVTGSCSK